MKILSLEHRRKIGVASLGRKLSAEAKEKIGKSHRGKKLSIEHRKKLSDAHKGIRLGEKLSKEVKEKISFSLKDKKAPKRNYWLGKKRESMTGEKHWFWKGGITPEPLVIRTSAEYKSWRREVFKRDGYRCVVCGDKQGKGHKVCLQADHIKPFALFPELRLVVGNGRTMCLLCHRKTETYGHGTAKLVYKLNESVK